MSFARKAITGALAAGASLIAAGAFAQQGGRTMTLDQLERKYFGMSPIHIEKCDGNGDGIYTQAEQACVASIYRVMYRND